MGDQLDGIMFYRRGSRSRFSFLKNCSTPLPCCLWRKGREEPLLLTSLKRDDPLESLKRLMAWSSIMTNTPFLSILSFRWQRGVFWFLWTHNTDNGLKIFSIFKGIHRPFQLKQKTLLTRFFTPLGDCIVSNP